MGTGGILSKKSWHVGRKENVQRVLRDEQKAREDADARQRQEAEEKKRHVYESLKSVARREERPDMRPPMESTHTTSRPAVFNQRDDDAAARGKASTRTCDARFDASFRLGGAAGTGSVPWYAFSADRRGSVGDTNNGARAEHRDTSKRKSSLLDAVKEVGKAKKLSKKDKRKRERDKLAELRAAREKREKLERERMKREMI